MMIKVRVDKAECFRRGIDHNSETVELDIAPEQLTEDAQLDCCAS
jgi:hypothetical protein